MKLLSRIIPSIVISVAAFIVFFVLFEVSILFSLMSGLAGFLGGFLLFSPKKIDPKMEELEKIHGISPKTLRKIVRAGKKKLVQMRKMSDTIENKTVKKKIENICQTTEKIFKDFEYDPKDIKAARHFLNYYLDATIKIIKHYSVLSKNRSDSSSKKTLKKVEELLDTIEKAFENQLARLYEDDFLDLDTEISVLENSIKFDGLTKKTGQQ